jgi:hypothetical protein
MDCVPTMLTEIVLYPDVEVIIEQERQPGETTGQVINRLIRASGHRFRTRPELPLLPGTLQVDIADTSETLARLEDTGTT